MLTLTLRKLSLVMRNKSSFLLGYILAVMILHGQLRFRTEIHYWLAGFQHVKYSSCELQIFLVFFWFFFFNPNGMRCPEKCLVETSVCKTDTVNFDNQSNVQFHERRYQMSLIGSAFRKKYELYCLPLGLYLLYPISNIIFLRTNVRLLCL